MIFPHPFVNSYFDRARAYRPPRQGCIADTRETMLPDVENFNALTLDVNGRFMELCQLLGE